MPKPQKGVWKRYICRQLNPDFGAQNTNTQGNIKSPLKPVVPQWNSNPKCRWSRAILLPLSLCELCAIIALAIIAEQFGKFRLLPDKEKFAENFGEFPCTCCWLLGMGEHTFPKVFPYFFPLAVFTVRTIWYIRYILKTDLNLMIPDVVVWQLMDFL